VGRLDGEVAVITGAARGQGEAEARRFVAEGASVLLTDVRDEQGAAVAESIGARAAYRRLDIGEEHDWVAAMADAEERFGPPTVLVNNAGVLRLQALETTSVEQYMDVVRINQLGCFLGMRAAIDPMRRAGHGSIVNISSVQGLQGMAYAISYVATKFAIRGMTKVAAIELGPLNIRVNSVHPGGVDTEMSTEAVRELGLDMAEGPGSDPMATMPLSRISRPDEIAAVVAFLASTEASYCTGAEFVVDGGWTAKPPF